MNQPIPLQQSQQQSEGMRRLEALERRLEVLDKRFVDYDRRISELEKTNKALRQAIVGGVEVPLVASDSELFGPYGDEDIRFDPRDWRGRSYKGHRMSECEPEYLDLLAAAFEDFAQTADAKGEQVKGKPKSLYERRKAAKARGWAAKLRSGWKPSGRPTAPPRPSWQDAKPPEITTAFTDPTPEELAEDQIPF